MSADPYEALEDLIDLGVDRILTSGQRPSASAGVELIAGLVERAEDRIIIMPGVGIDESNIAALIRETGAMEYHLFAEQNVPSAMLYRNHKVFMGSDPDLSEYDI